MMKFVKKNTSRKGARMSLAAGVSPSGLLIQPLPDAGESVPLSYLVDSRKNTGKP